MFLDYHIFDIVVSWIHTFITVVTFITSHKVNKSIRVVLLLGRMNSYAKSVKFLICGCTSHVPKMM